MSSKSNAKGQIKNENSFKREKKLTRVSMLNLWLGCDIGITS